MSEEGRSEVVSSTQPVIQERSNILDFFLSKEPVEDLNDKMNTLGLVNALIFTIPFSCLGDLNSDFFETLEGVFNSCSDQEVYGGVTFEYEKRVFRNNLFGVIYSSMCALLLISIYFIFKPPKKVQNNYIEKERLLLTTTFLATFASIVCTMNLSSALMSYYVIGNSDICSHNWSGEFTASMIALLLSVGVGVYCHF